MENNKDNWTQDYKGYWKFRDDKVSLHELEDQAQEWAKDEKYTNLHIRKVSSEQHGIGFTYSSDQENTKATHDLFTEEVSDKLKRKFGNGLAGWDISSSYLSIK